MFDRDRDHRLSTHIRTYQISLPLGMLCVGCGDVWLSVLFHLIILGAGDSESVPCVSPHNNTICSRGHGKGMRGDSA